MGNEVYANGREVSCKAAGGKSTASFPDVCCTPPQTPATPPGVPIPYPNTGMASDCSEGSKTVQISGQEVMLKDKSYFKTSTGNEAGSAPKKGVVSSKITGKVYFTMWSMDVKFEGENIVRHLDMTTHNHGNTPNTGPWPYTDAAARGEDGACGKEAANEKKACEDYDPHKKGGGSPCEAAGLTTPSSELTKDQASSMALAIQKGGGGKKKADMNEKEKALECVKARRCETGPYSPSKCCPSQTPDHVLPKASFYVKNTESARQPGWGGDDGYNPDKAPCMCAEGPNNSWGSHGLRHRHHKGIPPVVDGEEVGRGDMMEFEEAAAHAAEGASKVFPQCSKECVQHQIEQGHDDMHQSASAPDVKYAPSGRTETPAEVQAQVAKLNPAPSRSGGR
jgi:hypothetical protein